MLSAIDKYKDIGIPSSYWDNEIEVFCPRCESVALINNEEKKVRFTCSSCCKVKEIQHKEGAYYPTEWHGKIDVDPFFNYKLSLLEETPYGNIWVYNAEQLNHLKLYISAKLREKKEKDQYYAYYVSYFHKLPAWVKSSKNRDIILKKIALLEKKSITKPKYENPNDIINKIKDSFRYRWNIRNWKLLDHNEAMEKEYRLSFYPDFESKVITIKKFENCQLRISLTDMVSTNFISNKIKTKVLSLKNTTKGFTFRHTKINKPTIYLSVCTRKLEGEYFTVKELLSKVANISFAYNIKISKGLLHFEEGDYIYMFTESKSSQPDFAPSLKDETSISYGFSNSAIKKIISVITYT
jgi:hypothetical protein